MRFGFCNCLRVCNARGWVYIGLYVALTLCVAMSGFKDASDGEPIKLKKCFLWICMPLPSRKVTRLVSLVVRAALVLLSIYP